MKAVNTKTLKDCFSGLEDPRVDRNKKHKLMDIIIIAICAVISNANDWNEIETWAMTKEEWLKDFLELPNGIPSHDTFNRVFSIIDPRYFFNCFTEWIRSIQAVFSSHLIAIDGKTLRGSRDKRFQKTALHLVSAWCTDLQMSFGQVKTAEGSNEITAIKELLQVIQIQGCTVTIDAIGCQKEIATQIVEKGGNYVLALKKNQKNFYEDVQLYFDTLEKERFRDNRCTIAKTVEKDHGRIEKRICIATNDIDWLSEKSAWKSLSSIAVVISSRTIDGVTSTEKRYYISSLKPDAANILHSIRSHWGIENTLHWSLDVLLREDACRMRTKNNAENFAAIRRMVITLLKQETSKKISMKCKRLLAGWDNNYLLKIIGLPMS